MFYRYVSSSFALVVAAMLTGCGGHSFPILTQPVPSAAVPTAPADAALLVVHHGGPQDDYGIVVFTSDGEPLAQIPHRQTAHITLKPGKHRIYQTWNTRWVDAWDLEVVAGRVYYSAIWAGFDGWHHEKIVPSSPHWSEVPMIQKSPVATLDDTQRASLRDHLRQANFAALAAKGDDHYANGGEARRALRTFRPDDGQ